MTDKSTSEADEPVAELAAHLQRARETLGGSPDLLRSGIAEQIDRTLALLGGDADEAAAEMLERLGGSTEVEQRIARELLIDVPLVDPQDFLPAHRRVMRALEILDRDGTRACLDLAR